VHLNHVHEPAPPLRAVLTKPVVLSVANYFWLAFTEVALLALQPLFYSTPIHLGGLGMSPATIGLCLGIFGLLDGIVQGLVFPRVVRRVGLKKLFVTSLFCFVPLFALFPIINHFAREWGLSPAVWALVVFQFMLNCATEMAFGMRSLLNVLISLISSPSRQPRLLVPIHNLLRAESASTWECEWDRTNRCLYRSSAGPRGGNIPLRIYITD